MRKADIAATLSNEGEASGSRPETIGRALWIGVGETEEVADRVADHFRPYL
jgi:hypothetical protein